MWGDRWPPCGPKPQAKLTSALEFSILGFVGAVFCMLGPTLARAATSTVWALEVPTAALRSDGEQLYMNHREPRGLAWLYIPADSPTNSGSPVEV